MAEKHDRLNQLLAVKLELVRCARSLEVAGLPGSSARVKAVAARIQRHIEIEEKVVAVLSPRA